MHIFIAGASGAVGRSLIPTLLDHGHTVTGTARSAGRAEGLRALGARPAVMDGLDREAVRAAVIAARPDVIVHQMTALASADFGNFDKSFATTNRLRTEGTEHLLAAAREAGVTRLLAQSFAGWPFARTGGPVKSEDAALDPDPPKGMRETLAAIVRLERLVTGAGGVVLRYGGFYGPGTGLAPGGAQVQLLTSRKFPVVGDGGGVWSFIHSHDIGSATVAAIERARGGEIYHLVDDDPAPVREWLPFLARVVGAPPPRRIPVWLARLVAGPGTVAMMTESRGASNAKARDELGWTPQWPSWRQGFPSLWPAAGEAHAHAATPASRCGAVAGGVGSRQFGDHGPVPNYLIRKQLIALGDDFWVEDEDGERVFHVDGKALRPRKTFVIETPEGDELVRIREQRLRLRKTMRIERQGEELATIRKDVLTPLHDHFTVELVKGGVLEVKGDLLGHEFTIAWESGVAMAEISKRWFAVRDTYGLSVEPDQDAVLALAIAVCVDAIERDG